MSVRREPQHASAIRTLAGAQLPARVHAILDTLLRTASAELEQRLETTLVEFEQQLFRLADHARNPAIESGYLQTLRTLRLNRADLIPRFLLGVESALARLDQAGEAPPAEQAPAAPPGSPTLALVDDARMDAELVLRDIAQRSAARASLPLHLLGQRFGVLAAAPAFDAERVPLGPWVLCTQLHEASAALQLPPESQLLLLRTFERKAMADYDLLAELFNVVLAEAGVLPALSYVPLRLRPSPAPADAAQSTQPASAHRGPANDPGQGAAARGRPHASWLPQADGDMRGREEIGFDALQALLAARHSARPGGPARSLAQASAPSTGTAELMTALGQIRANLARPDATVPGIGELKREVLLRMRERHGADAGLSQEDSDTFDLLGMLYERIEREVRAETRAADLLRQLQLPVLHTALRDRGFFTQPQHPARQLLNTVAESGARWLGEHDTDPLLEAPIRRAVEHVVRNAHHDPAAFDSGNQALQHELQLYARRSEMAERRHVEAARGREKLEVARRLAADTLAGMLAPHAPPKFVRALIEQAWADVLTLNLLRHGADSPQWERMLETSRRIVAVSCSREPAADPELAAQVEGALSQVGYHAGEAAAIARRLTSQPDAEDGASRTELAAALKARARLGEGAGGAARRIELPPRTPEEQAQFERVRTLPFGTWIEFVVNQQGDIVRQRLSWYSTVTGNALFVNLRGQRTGEQTLDGLARTIARGQARVVTAERARPVDRAWQATLAALRGLAGRGAARGAGARA